MKKTLHFKAEFAISEGKIKEYKKLIKEMSNVVKANEPDTIITSFISTGPRQGALYMKHTKILKIYFLMSMGLHQKQFFQGSMISRITRFEVFGAGSKKLQKAMEGLDPHIYILFTGFSRQAHCMAPLIPFEPSP